MIDFLLPCWADGQEAIQKFAKSGGISQGLPVNPHGKVGSTTINFIDAVPDSDALWKDAKH